MPDEVSVFLTDRVCPLMQQQRFDEAEALLRQALPNSETDRVDPRIVGELANVLREKGKHGEAAPLYRRALQGEAEPLYRRALKSFELLYGPSDKRTVDVVLKLAITLADQGMHGEAEPLYRRALQGYEQLYGPSDNRAIDVVRRLADVLQELGKLVEAEPLYCRALHYFKELNGPSHSTVLQAACAHACVVRQLAAQTNPVPHTKEAVAAPSSIKQKAAAVSSNVAVALAGQGKHGEAEPLFRRALQGYTHIYGPSDNRTIDVVPRLAVTLAVQGKHGRRCIAKHCRASSSCRPLR